jgi:hypothetical protein
MPELPDEPKTDEIVTSDVAAIEPMGEPIPEKRARYYLSHLILAEPCRAEIEQGRYEEARQKLDEEHKSPAEENNLGCAYAWLAHTEKDDSYWRNALDALGRSRKGDKRRADTNIELVHSARKVS